MISKSGFYSDGSSAAPALRIYLNLGNLVDLPATSVWPGGKDHSQFQQLLNDGFEGVQLITDEAPGAAASLPFCGLDRINVPGEAGPIVAKHAARGDQCITVHAGWGMEDDDAVDRLVEAILAASLRHGLPVFLETHRATITQDLWRTVEMTKRFPEIRFNGDFSHYYTGQELVYGNWEEKLRFMLPIFSRIGFLHGRIASPGCIQAPIDSDLSARPMQAHGAVNYLEHFRELWSLSMLGFLRHARAGDVLIFAPELLSPAHYYARVFSDATGQLNEESDRYAQALLYKDLARACFVEAQRQLEAERH